MANIDQFVPRNSKYLSKEDVGEAGRNLTIAGFDHREITADGKTDSKAVLEWQERDVKPMVLNQQNAQLLKAICKTSDTDQMIGRVVNVYNDPYVMFGNKAVGGIRLRPPAHAQYQNQQQAPQQAQQAAPQRPQAQPQGEWSPPQQNQDWQPTPPPEAYEDEPQPPQGRRW